MAINNDKELEEAVEALLALGYKTNEQEDRKFFEGTTDTEKYINLL